MQSNEIIAKELIPGETILWSGQPNPHKYFTVFDIFMIPFSILWFAFGISWIVSAYSSGGLFWVFGIPILPVGAYITVGRFFVKRNKKSLTHYALTNKRVLCITASQNGDRRKAVTANTESISGESTSFGRQRVGSIIFGQVPFYQTFYMNTGMDFFAGLYASSIPAFFDIDDAEKVYDIYKKAKFKM